MRNKIETFQQIIFSVTPGVPSAARELIWEVFFASRQRGIDLPTHFPWIENNLGTYCLMLAETNYGPVVATLVLRIHNLTSGNRFAMIGMVCVDQAWRGQGLSTKLLANVFTFATEQQINSILLWTGQPSVYSRHGFAQDTDTCDTLGRVMIDPLRLRAHVGFTKGHADTTRGLPPFGQRLCHFESDAAELIGVETDEGIALAEWKGPLWAVLDLIETAFPSTWYLNAPSDSLIIDEVLKRGHIYTPLQCAKRMVRHLNAPVKIPYISVLDRI